MPGWLLPASRTGWVMVDKRAKLLDQNEFVAGGEAEPIFVLLVDDDDLAMTEEEVAAEESRRTSRPWRIAVVRRE